MKNKEIYSAWKKQRSRIEVSQDFSQAVMDRIYQYQQGESRPLLDGCELIELVSAHRLAKAAVVAAGAAVGLVRIMFLVYAFLGC